MNVFKVCIELWNNVAVVYLYLVYLQTTNWIQLCLFMKKITQSKALSFVYTCCWWCSLCLKFLVVGCCINFSCCSINSCWWFIDCIFSSVCSSCQWWWNCAGLKFLDLFSCGGNCAGICSPIVSCRRIFKFSCFCLFNQNSYQNMKSFMWKKPQTET